MGHLLAGPGTGVPFPVEQPPSRPLNWTVSVTNQAPRQAAQPHVFLESSRHKGISRPSHMPICFTKPRAELELTQGVGFSDAPTLPPTYTCPEWIQEFIKAGPGY